MINFCGRLSIGDIAQAVICSRCHYSANISSGYIQNSEANASELLKNLEEKYFLRKINFHFTYTVIYWPIKIIDHVIMYYYPYRITEQIILNKSSEINLPKMPISIKVKRHVYDIKHCIWLNRYLILFFTSIFNSSYVFFLCHFFLVLLVSPSSGILSFCSRIKSWSLWQQTCPLSYAHVSLLTLDGPL